jgi:hypothetical protein
MPAVVQVHNLQYAKSLNTSSPHSWTVGVCMAWHARTSGLADWPLGWNTPKHTIPIRSTRIYPGFTRSPPAPAPYPVHPSYVLRTARNASTFGPSLARFSESLDTTSTIQPSELVTFRGC